METTIPPTIDQSDADKILQIYMPNANLVSYETIGHILYIRYVDEQTSRHFCNINKIINDAR